MRRIIIGVIIGATLVAGPMRSDGSAPAAPLASVPNAGVPAWSPDGTRLASDIAFDDRYCGELRRWVVMDVASRADIEPFTTKDGSTIREYLHTQAQSLAEASLEPGQSTQRHYHRASEEIYLLVEGGGLMEVDGEEREVVAGDAILIPPGAWHTLVAGGDGARLLCCCVPPYSHDDTHFS
jgi:quercetin dioxygenase-like cupin family protein